MKRLIGILWFTLVFNILTIHQIEAASLHAILVGDTMGGEDGFQSGIDYMKHEVQRIAALTDLKLNALSFTGYQVRTQNILHHLSKLDIKPNDIVILYFNLHGSRTHEKKNQWPDLNFRIDIALSGNKGYLDFAQINEKIKSKNPRLLLSLAESCNVYRDDNIFDEDTEDDLSSEGNEQAFPIPKPSCRHIALKKNKMDFIKETTEEEVIKAYRHLFLNQKGSIIISSSTPGEPAIKLPIIGGIYTIQFLSTLHDITDYWETLCNRKTKDLSWQLILEQASRATVEELSLRGEIETPQYEIDLE